MAGEIEVSEHQFLEVFRPFLDGERGGTWADEAKCPTIYDSFVDVFLKIGAIRSLWNRVGVLKRRIQ